jgi:hypothetical protein
MLSPDQKGTVAELAIALAAHKLGVSVYHPFNESGRFDMILEVRGRLLRAQCKVAARYSDGVIIRCYSSRRSRNGLAPTRNNQRDKIRWAGDFRLCGYTCATRGAIAQLGERLHGMQEVAGSSPAGSIAAKSTARPHSCDCAMLACSSQNLLRFLPGL